MCESASAGPVSFLLDEANDMPQMARRWVYLEVRNATMVGRFSYVSAFTRLNILSIAGWFHGISVQMWSD